MRINNKDHATHETDETDALIPQENKAERRSADLIPLFRLLSRRPPMDHDFRNCPICKRYGITEI